MLLKKEVPYDAADDAEKYKNEDNYYNYHPCLHLSKFLLPLFLSSCRRRTPLARVVGMLREMGTLKPLIQLSLRFPFSIRFFVAFPFSLLYRHFVHSLFLFYFCL